MYKIDFKDNFLFFYLKNMFEKKNLEFGVCSLEFGVCKKKMWIKKLQYRCALLSMKSRVWSM